ncbi:YD repeat-containing protein [Dyadobacter soli]|uniref:YD repeat-containing protein n=1 Tax=Dyadobacter soli TaxID=659014 RepID=A0A1G8A1P7_9BACT|nr:hypothetical protein [Dyadobacter soli]SDH14852.1 YD repeat-containing protein [Dyadobacter soli]
MTVISKTEIKFEAIVLIIHTFTITNVMKKLQLAGNLLKALMLAGVMTACQNQDAVAPLESTTPLMEQAAKTNAELKLVKDGTTNLQYIKQGRLTGKLSKVSETAFYTQYSYDDSTGDLWITSKRYNKSSNVLVQEIKYKIVNGRCVTSINQTTNWTSEYKYNEMGRLDEVNLSSGALTQKHTFTYDNVANSIGKERLKEIIKSSPIGPYQQINFFYTLEGSAEKLDNYPLNSEHLGFDKYLPYFGKFSDVLIQQVQITPLPFTNQAKPYYKHYYTINSDGYLIGRNIEYFPLGYGKEAGKMTFYNVHQYSSNWQGI